ncbi:MAG: GNAT family N-acetyltransferase [Pseudohongiellaceae bacterium]|nr:GNAT family N-acetyltransferase [Pseudohongiellaceae bacterium]
MSKLHSKKFDELTIEQLYAIIRLREEVFVLEQECAYLDADGLDKEAIHLWFEQETQIASYCRILPPNTRFLEASIGRVCTQVQFRGKGLAKELLLHAIAACEKQYPGQGISLSSQAHLRQFYEDLGFSAVSNIYDEDGIPHIKMHKP